MKVQIQLLSCKNCGKHVLAFNDPRDGCGQRLNSHKCSGAWTVIETFDCEFTLDELKMYDRAAAPAAAEPQAVQK